MTRRPVGVLDRDASAQAELAAAVERGLETLRRRGYVAVETPAFEALELYQRLYGREIQQRLITFMTDREYALRPDLTAGLCRALAGGLLVEGDGGPVRVASSGLAWRHERIRPLRLREFHQLGLERIGDRDPAEAAAGELEALGLALEVVSGAGIAQAVVRLGHAGARQRILEHLTVVTPAPRRGLDDVLDVTARLRERFAPPCGRARRADGAEVDPHAHEDARHILEVGARLAVRAAKVPEAPPEALEQAGALLAWLDGVLWRQAEALGLGEAQREALLALTAPEASLEALAARLEVLQPGAGAEVVAALEPLTAPALPAGFVRTFSLAASRGAGFYTGMTLEVDAPILGPDAGQLIGGGRYDGAMGLLGGAPQRGIGWALGVERLVAAARLA